MKYTASFKKRAVKDWRAIPTRDREMILERIGAMEDDLSGDVKKLTNYSPEYRMRCGNWRVLFEVEGEQLVIYRVLNRKDGRLPVSIHPQIIERDGKKEFVVLPYEEFLAIKEALEDFDDLKELREAKADAEPESGIPLSQVRSELLGN